MKHALPDFAFWALWIKLKPKINFRTLRALFEIIQFILLDNAWTDSVALLKNCHKCNYCRNFKAQDQERFNWDLVEFVTFFWIIFWTISK